MGGDAQDVHGPDLDLHDEEDVQTQEQHDVHAKKSQARRTNVGATRNCVDPLVPYSKIPVGFGLRPQPQLRSKAREPVRLKRAFTTPEGTLCNYL